MLVSQYRIDNEYSNSYEAWKAMGSPQDPTPEQYRALEQSGQLQMNTSPAFRNVSEGRLDVDLVLPRQGVALIRLSW